jgi:diadenosine tetraphosphate (Ap4A) HIT family hydrolase
MAAPCYSCGTVATPDVRPWQRIYRYGGFYVAHALGSSLAGWLVIVSDRHVESLGDLDPDEGASLGLLLRATSVALERVLDVPKSYVIFLAEAQGFSHLHVHVVPRSRDLPADRRGPDVFAYLKDGPDLEISEDDRDALAIELAAAITLELGPTA